MAGAAGGTLHAGDGILSLHALEQAADALEVAVAAADDLDGLDGVVIVQHDVGLLGTGAHIGEAERFAHGKHPLFLTCLHYTILRRIVQEG